MSSNTTTTNKEELEKELLKEKIKETKLSQFAKGAAIAVSIASLGFLVWNNLKD